MMGALRSLLFLGGGLGLAGCTTAGSTWMAQPLDGSLDSELNAPPPERSEQQPAPHRSSTRSVVIGGDPSSTPEPTGTEGSSGYVQARPRSGAPSASLAGNVLGTFKNTYYDFPNEGDFEGEPLSLMSPSCKPLVSVPRSFYESVCVQGSGTLKAGGTVSFAKRDCDCAALCPRTGQHICFDLLDKAVFPWGRGATGKPITPLLTVAVDSSVIPLGTPIYIPEYDGIPRDPSSGARHDGCFVAEDRGLAVKGQHVDIFTGQREITQLWNKLVPSNQGVTVVMNSPKCVRAPTP
jgi:3D (Asp-Asp-Asp) domain-containing protein